MIGQSAVPRIVLIQIRIQEEQWHAVAADAAKQVAPGPNAHISAFYRNCHLGRQRFKTVFRRPLRRGFQLIPLGIQALFEIALSVKKSYGYHRGLQVCRRAKRVTGQDPQPSAVRGNARVDSYIHRKVGNSSRIEMSKDSIHNRQKLEN